MDLKNIAYVIRKKVHKVPNQTAATSLMQQAAVQTLALCPLSKVWRGGQNMSKMNKYLLREL